MPFGSISNACITKRIYAQTCFSCLQLELKHFSLFVTVLSAFFPLFCVFYSLKQCNNVTALKWLQSCSLLLCPILISTCDHTGVTPGCSPVSYWLIVIVFKSKCCSSCQVNVPLLVLRVIPACALFPGGFFSFRLAILGGHTFIQF